MTRTDWRAKAEALLEHARAVRDGRTLVVPPPSSFGGVVGAGDSPKDAGQTTTDDEACAAVRAALGYLLDEVRLVAAGRAGTTAVLADEIAHTEAAVARL